MDKNFAISCKNRVQSVRNYVAGAGAAVVALLSTAPAYAALDLTGVTVDTADYISIATFLITALVAFWGIKKGLALIK